MILAMAEECREPETGAKPERSRRKLARRAIDCGSLIILTHPDNLKFLFWHKKGTFTLTKAVKRIEPAGF
jgi:hypothetical protein